MTERFIRRFALAIFTLAVFLFLAVSVSAEERKQMIVNGDKVEFFTEQKKITAEGNVVIVYQDAKLTCDKVVVYSDTNDAVAEGNVRLYSAKGNLEGEKLVYNFTRKTGIITGAKLQSLAPPFYGAAKNIEKFSDQHLGFKKGFITTCDLAKPHYRLTTRRIEIFPGEKIIANDVRFVIGKATLFYLPRFTQVLNDKRPSVTVMPGYDKKWGFYLLQAWRYYFNENSKGLLHLDYREKKDFAWGIDYSYKTPKTGEGLIRTYYMNERSIEAKRTFLPRISPTIEKERFKAEWRHKWQINENTNAIWQYYKLKDAKFIKDYFEREYEKDEQPKSFLLLTHTFPWASLNFDVEKRVNHFFATTEKLPEIKLDVFNQKIGDTRFYFGNQTSYATLAQKTAQPAATDPKGKQTERVDTYNEFSRQQKIAFIETRPYVAMRQTYFSRGNDTTADTDIIRGIFYTGIDLSTKFYRVFDTETNFWNLNISKLRHIITPTASYNYIHEPTVNASKLFPFDSIDAINRQNQVNLALENKLQTKREGASVDLLRFILSTDYLFKHDPEGSRFDHITSDLEIKPYNWMTFSGDSSYDTRTETLQTVNFDIFADGGDNWYVGFGRRFQRKSSNEVTGEFAYRINPKWKFRVYERFDSRKGNFTEQEYTIIRDLHCWEMEINYNTTPGLGNSIWLIFRIKAFPKMGLEFQNAFHQRKFGSQSSTGE